MPNWCSNSVYITHIDREKLDRLITAFRAGRMMQEFLPCPSKLYDGEGWYSWCIDHWGTKWDVGGHDGSDWADWLDQEQQRLALKFDSAWAPPIGFYDYLVNHEGFDVRAFYYEPGMQFAGLWHNGSDEHYEEWGNSRGAAEMLPECIDQEFDIVNSQAMWEDDTDQEDAV
jgi:hypothetical protein